jgi:predicted acetyltransferase
MYPWIGFVYTYPKYRGKRMMGILFDHIFSLAKKENHKQIYLSTNEVGLYEKYGFEYYKNMDDIQGNDSRIYVKKL